MSQNLFIDTSDLDIDPTTRIISLSDIHGDIDALIIALRDCAKVIEPLSGLPNIGNNIRDPELDRLLNLNLMDLANMKEFDNNANLNFRWIGRDTHVILVGDTIDPVRKNKLNILETGSLEGKRNANDLYTHSEIKILKFLNKLDELANLDGGRVIKLLGNHEIGNFNSASFYSSLYTHDGNELMPYINKDGKIHTLSRKKFFNLEQPGFYLFMERGSGVFLRINNILFMHGQLYNSVKPHFNYDTCDKINKELNKKNVTIQSSDPDFLSFMSAPQLWDRDYGDNGYINQRITNSLNEKKFCERIIMDIASFFGSHPIIKVIPIEKFKLVIGHCPQTFSTWYNETNRTFLNKTILSDGISVQLTPHARTFKTLDINPKTGKTYLENNDVFGISMECPANLYLGQDINNDSDEHHQIYKVDVGVSRAFDQDAMYIADDNVMKHYFLSRVPQVLELHGDNVRILRSTVKNTRIHQIRGNYEKILKSNPNLAIDNMTYGGYKQKYLKYKQKYMDLKKKFNLL